MGLKDLLVTGRNGWSDGGIRAYVARFQTEFLERQNYSMLFRLFLTEITEMSLAFFYKHVLSFQTCVASENYSP